MAAPAMASSLLVVLPMAETTTTGLRAALALTMDATRSMAAADSTEVPPNFITIIAAPWRLCPSVQHSLRVHELGVQNGGAGGSANRVVRKGHELVVKHGTGAQAADEGCHTPVALGVLARLRAVVLRHVADRTRGRARQAALLRNAGEFVECAHEIGL